MTLQSLRDVAYRANLGIAEYKLAALTWGNASAFDSETGLMAIKPSGVVYSALTPESIVVLDVATGKTIAGSLKPSSDTPTHLVLYRAFPQIGGIVHTHSPKATAWAQAGKDLPCYGTTHADHFFGNVPCTPPLTEDEIHTGDGYEANTGAVLVREFAQRGLSPLDMPAILLHGHAPFTFGMNALDALGNAVALEAVAGMALDTLMIRAESNELDQMLRNKHFKRKHGTGAYYGQSA